VWYKTVGVGRKGIPVLTLHGGPGSPHDYLEPLEALSTDRPITFYDQLGCGNSDNLDDTSLWTIDRFVEELSAVRRFLRLSKVHILGSSWGTLLAVEYLLRKKPRGVISLVLSSPILSASRYASDVRSCISVLPGKARRIILEGLAASNFEKPEYRDAMMLFNKRHMCRLDPWPDCVNRTFQRIAESVYVYMWGPTMLTITGTLRGFELVDRLKEVKVPTLLTVGRHDYISPETARYYHSMLPDSEVHVFEGASHIHNVEREDEYVRVVGDFLVREERRME